jgi:hypothetical protein
MVLKLAEIGAVYTRSKMKAAEQYRSLLKQHGHSHIIPDEPRLPQAENAVLDNLKRVLEKPAAQKELVDLYRESQSEHTRNGKLNMEVGSAREAAFIALLSRYRPGMIDNKIDNKKTEDFGFLGDLFSVKHVSAQLGSGSIKFMWAADDKTAKKCMDSKDVGSANMIIVFLDTKRSLITIVAVSKEMMTTLINGIGRDKALKSATGTDNRGVSFSPAMIKAMVRNHYFMTEIQDVDLSGGLDPIQRRMKYLEDKFGPADCT